MSNTTLVSRFVWTTVWINPPSWKAASSLSQLISKSQNNLLWQFRWKYEHERAQALRVFLSSTALIIFSTISSGNVFSLQSSIPIRAPGKGLLLIVSRTLRNTDIMIAIRREQNTISLGEPTILNVLRRRLAVIWELWWIRNNNRSGFRVDIRPPKQCRGRPRGWIYGVDNKLVTDASPGASVAAGGRLFWVITSFPLIRKASPLLCDLRLSIQDHQTLPIRMKPFRLECDRERLELRTAVTLTEARSPRVQAIVLRFGCWRHGYVYENSLWFVQTNRGHKQTVITLDSALGLPSAEIQREFRSYLKS